MKKRRSFLYMLLLILTMCAALCFAGCGSQTKSETEETQEDREIREAADGDEALDPDELAKAFEDELTPVEGEELELLENGLEEDEEMVPVDEEELELLGDIDENVLADPGVGSISVEEDGSYTTKDEVAAYIHSFGHLPANYITKSEARKLGWESSKGNLWDVAPGMSIGGDTFGNYEKMLPEEDGRVYYECDINFDGSFRNAERIIYSNDGLIFYTGDHYETFEELY